MYNGPALTVVGREVEHMSVEVERSTCKLSACLLLVAACTVVVNEVG